MSSLVEAIAKQAQVTFSRSTIDEEFSDSLTRLIRSVSRVKAADLNLSRDFGKTAKGNGESPSPPVTYIAVEENPTFTMGMFLLQNGAQIPLHDHPGMHGVLKVIQGTVKITSYSPVSNVPGDNKIPQDIINRIESTEIDSLIPVETHMCANVTDEDEACVLGPRAGNYHEISAVEGPAAFFDVLAPPYECDTEERDCHFYVVLETNKPDSKVKTWLLRTEPTDFWIEPAPYTGSKVSL